MAKDRDSWWSMAGVVLLALVLPILVRGVNVLQRWAAGAQGRLAAISVDTDKVLGPMPAPWRGVAQGGDELKTFMDKNPSEVTAWKPEQIRIDHIYDQFGVVTREGANLKFDWSELDILVGKIASSGARPFFSLSYMPPAISSGDEVAAPKSWDEWALIVQRTIEHYSGKLGFEGLYYEVWNEPDLFGKWTVGGKKDYRKLYAYAAWGAAAAKNVKPFKLGGPATTGLYKNWAGPFLTYAHNNNLRMDFYSWHRYDKDVGVYREDLANLDEWATEYPLLSRAERIVSETGLTSEVPDIENERVAAAQLLAVARELLYKVRWGFNFSVSGQWGMAGNLRGEAMRLLSRMGPVRLPVEGEGTWVRAMASRTGETVAVMVVNYDPAKAHLETVPVSFLNLRPGTYQLKGTFLGGESEVETVATTAAMWQKHIPMPPNSAVLLELSPKL